MGVTSAEYRRLMSNMPTSVSVLAVTGAAGEPHGLTVNAIASVSLEPPVLLACIHRDARLRALLGARTPFVLNVLSASQAELARQFASSMRERFQGVSYETSPDGPRICGAMAHITCIVRDVADVGDHAVIYADVTGGRALGSLPLVFFAGGYTSTAASDAPSTAPA
jgi:flavin reductase (DIM6/NTAB) family NADH-FMN oxidoreductase RutF